MVVKKVVPGSVVWGPEAESDDEGYVDQVSFVPDDKIRTDEGERVVYLLQVRLRGLLEVLEFLFVPGGDGEKLARHW